MDGEERRSGLRRILAELPSSGQEVRVEELPERVRGLPDVDDAPTAFVTRTGDVDESPSGKTAGCSEPKIFVVRAS